MGEARRRRQLGVEPASGKGKWKDHALDALADAARRGRVVEWKPNREQREAMARKNAKVRE